MSLLPRYGYVKERKASAFLGRGPDAQHSLRLAYGPGPAGSFETSGGGPFAYADQPPFHVYKSRNTCFRFTPTKSQPKQYRTTAPPTPSWADRLTMTPGMAAQYKREREAKTTVAFQLRALMKARVKVERKEGDFARGYDKGADGKSVFFSWLSISSWSRRVANSF